jgi:hypothetical protein
MQDMIDPYDPYYDDMMYSGGSTEPDNTRFEIHYADILERFEHSLKNEMEVNGVWKRPEGISPRMNEIGIMHVMSDLWSLLHKGTVLGFTTEEFVHKLTLKKSLAYMRKLLILRENWDVEKSDMESLILDYDAMCFLVLTRSIGGQERKTRTKRFGFLENYKHNEVSPEEILGRNPVGLG